MRMIQDLAILRDDSCRLAMGPTNHRGADTRNSL
jgi:hypothetical protein